MKDIEFKETNIGAIPASWSVGRIGDLAKVQGGFAFKSDDFGDKGIGVIKIRNIASRRIDLLNVQRVSEEVFESVRKEFILQTGDVLIAMTGAELGKIGIIPETKDRFVLNQRVGKFVSSSQDDILYLYEILNSAEYQKRIFDTAHGSAQPNISSTTIESISIPIPSILERQKIAKVLFSIDEKIETNNQMNKTLEAIGQVLFKQWFIDFKFPGYERTKFISGLPEGWRLGKLGEIIVNFDSKRVPLSSRERDQRKGDYPYYGAASVVDYVDDYLFDGIYVLMGEDGTVVTDKGLPTLQYVWGKFWVNNHAHVLQGKEHVPTEYILLILQQTNVQHMVTGAVQPKINQSNMNNLSVVIPEEEIFAKFNLVIKPIYENFRNNIEESILLTQIRDSLLPKLMSGKIRVTAPHGGEF